MIPVKNKQSVLCFGEILWDVFPDKEKIGGAPLNVALHLKKQNIDVSIASAIGKDLKGEGLVNYIASEGLAVNLIQVDPSLPTSEVIITLDSNKNASYTISEPVAWDNITKTNSLIEKIKTAGVLVYSTLASRNGITRETLNELLKYARLKVFDINLRPPFDKPDVIDSLLSKADIAKFNDDELVKVQQHYNLSGSEAEVLAALAAKFSLKTICLTKGGNGAMLYHNGEIFEHKGYIVKAVDTVGAGDAFLASFLAGYMQQKSFNEILDNACAIGAYVVTQPGANPVYDEKTILDFKNTLKPAVV